MNGATIRAGLRAIVTRTPEVMVKVTGGGRGMGAITAHLSYISRKGELSLENQDGLQLKGKEALADLADEWRYGGGLIPEVSHRREAIHVMLSMPPGTDPQVVYNAARALAREEFAKHKYALVLHDPATDPDSNRPHVHMIVRAQSRDWTRLQPKKADLAQWRQGFAERLMERGVAASATRRQSRGVIQPALKLRDYHRGEKAKKWPIEPGIAAQCTEREVQVAWQHVIQALNTSANLEDRDLARKIGEYTGRMQIVTREAYLVQVDESEAVREAKPTKQQERQRLLIHPHQAHLDRQLQVAIEVKRELQGPLQDR